MGKKFAVFIDPNQQGFQPGEVLLCPTELNAVENAELDLVLIQLLAQLIGRRRRFKLGLDCVLIG